MNNFCRYLFLGLVLCCLSILPLSTASSKPAARSDKAAKNKGSSTRDHRGHSSRHNRHGPRDDVGHGNGHGHGHGNGNNHPNANNNGNGNNNANGNGNNNANGNGNTNVNGNGNSNSNSSANANNNGNSNANNNGNSNPGFSDDGIPTGPGASTPPAPPAPRSADSPEPEFAESVDANVVSGTVTVQVPGSSDFKIVPAGLIPNGSVIDARYGAIQLNVEAPNGRVESAVFSGALFRITQDTRGERFTNLDLGAGDLMGCPRPGRPGVHFKSAFGLKSALGYAARRRSSRRLWGNGRGRFRTRGRYGSASVRGTVWLTEDRCDGTRVAVSRGSVTVNDDVRHKTVIVRAGHSHLVRPPL